MGGFCGLALKARVTLRAEAQTLSKYIFIAEIRPSTEPKLSRRQMVPKQEIANQLRTKYDSTAIGGELFLAETNIISNDGEEAVIDLMFNANQCSYDYSWKSNRWSGPDITHVINIVALKNSSETEFMVTSDCISTPFVIASSHKKFIKPKTISDVENMAAAMTEQNKKRKYTRREPGAEDAKPKKTNAQKNAQNNKQEEFFQLDINEGANILSMLSFMGRQVPAQEATQNTACELAADEDNNPFPSTDQAPSSSNSFPVSSLPSSSSSSSLATAEAAASLIAVASSPKQVNYDDTASGEANGSIKTEANPVEINQQLQQQLLQQQEAELVSTAAAMASMASMVSVNIIEEDSLMPKAERAK